MTTPSQEGAATRANTQEQPKDATGVLVLADGSLFWGRGLGAEGASTGELCFNTSMTGYQEITTDPSYAGQIITFTFPHIGNTGINMQDVETQKPSVRGVVLREQITTPSSWRAAGHLEDWLDRSNLIGISGLDTRALTIRIRDLGAPNAVIAHNRSGKFDIEALKKTAREWPGLEGMDLAKDVTCARPYDWNEGAWKWYPQKHAAYAKPNAGRHHVVAIDYGAKYNILRCLVNAGCHVTVVPATATADEIFALKPDGVFLSNGPGDPAATGIYAAPVIKAILDKGIPLFGICLGHQILALALGAKTAKMPRGHRGANHPVKDLATGKIDITSQNHGFMVLPETLPPTAEVTHISLFDNTNEGIRLKDKPAFSIQYHPEASPGPHDSHYLFKRFVEMIETYKAARESGMTSLTKYGNYAILKARQKIIKRVIWMSGSQEQMRDMPLIVRSAFGHALWEVQIGNTPLDMKPLPGLGNGICELRESFDTNAYRLIYIAKLKKGVYVLDVFMKKSKSGIGLPKMDAERIKARYREAVKLDREH